MKCPILFALRGHTPFRAHLLEYSMNFLLLRKAVCSVAYACRKPKGWMAVNAKLEKGEEVAVVYFNL
jgi:hypothetical protein